jgi:N6-adenosine-specific RNA methylase IME4
MEFPTKKYNVIYADPPWEMGKMGKGKDTRPGRVYKVGEAVPVPYPTMKIEEILNLPVPSISGEEAHLWLWATNKILHDAFHVMEKWGFKYLNILTYNKPAGVGPWFVNTTQHLLFGYKGGLKMGDGRYSLTSQYYTPVKHSKKPVKTYELIESISPYSERIELFARNKRDGWDSWGNEV